MVLVGDFNATSLTRPYQRLAARLFDAQKAPAITRTLPTFPSAFPVLRIDHCFTSPGVAVTGVQTPYSPLARMASDHLPLVVDFELSSTAAASAA